MNGTDELEGELARSRETAGRLLETLAGKVHAIPAVRNAAQYWQDHSARQMAVDVRRAVRRNPAPVIAVALVAGFLLGCALYVRRRARLD